MPEPEWHYAQGDKQMPPVSFQTLQDLIRNGNLQRQDRVWTQGMAQWTPAGDVQALAAIFPIPMATPIPMAPMPNSPMPQYPTSPLPMAGQAPLPLPPPDPMLQYQTPPWAFAQYVNYAGFWRRFAAYIIDSILLWIAQSIPITLAGMNPIMPHRPGTPYNAALLTIQIFGWLFSWFYFALMESSHFQGTIGKLALDIKVTDMQGNRVSFGRATGRFFGKIISGIILCIGYMMAGWTERKQALHDMMAGTLVICRS
jgi:uncharacterized RDD family membrane protein YckC